MITDVKHHLPPHVVFVEADGSRSRMSVNYTPGGTGEGDHLLKCDYYRRHEKPKFVPSPMIFGERPYDWPRWREITYKKMTCVYAGFRGPPEAPVFMSWIEEKPRRFHVPDFIRRDLDISDVPPIRVLHLSWFVLVEETYVETFAKKYKGTRF